MKKLLLRIEPGLENMRLDKALVHIPEIRTRSRATKLIEQGRVKSTPYLNGGRRETPKPSHVTQLGEEFEITLPEETASELRPLEINLDIVHEDSDLIVINKPAGLVMHPAAGHAQDTLVNALLHHTKNLSMGFSEQRPGIVHRLDKETSGLIVVAKNNQAHEQLAKQFHERTIDRIYWAITYGHWKTRAGRMESHLARHPSDRKRFASSKLNHGKRAVTHYKILRDSAQGLSWLEVKLETGRTHQIRVHVSEAGHAIVGDQVYGSSKRTNILKSGALKKFILQMDRIALHATVLGFTHPRTGERLSFSAAWPNDLKNLIQLGGLQ